MSLQINNFELCILNMEQYSNKQNSHSTNLSPEDSLSLTENLENIGTNINRLKKIKFITKCYEIENYVIIDIQQLNKWKKNSEYIDTVLNSYHDEEILEINLSKIVDMYSLLIIFNFFETEKLHNVEYHQKLSILNGLAYFGVKSHILNSIKKGLGLVWKLTQVDAEIQNFEHQLKTELDIIKKMSDSTKQKFKYENMDNNIILNKDTYNVLYEKLYNSMNNVTSITCGQKLRYETLSNFCQKIHPEFHLSFIKQEFEKLSLDIFKDIPDCVVAGGMISKHFTYNSYFIDTDYDVFLLTNCEKRAFEIIKLLYDRMNTKLKTYILKTKNTVTLYNSKYEVQIITKFYNNITEVFTHFDLDSCCVGYSNGKLYALPRFIRSLAYSGNVFDPYKNSPSYIHRLKKYNKRGFNIYIPGLNKNDNDYNKNNCIVKILREKSDRFEKDSDYCDFFVCMKNRNNKEINEILDYYHNRNKFMDTFQIENIHDIFIKNKFNFNWNITSKSIQNDYYKDMYFSNYIV